MIQKRILITTGIFPPDIGGPATYSKLLFDKLSKQGFQIKILTYGNKEQSQKNIFIVSGKWPKGLKHLIYFLKVLFLGFNSDIILVADSSFGAAFVSVLATKIIRKKIIVRVTGDYVWEQGVQRFGVIDNMDDFQNNEYGFIISLMRRMQNFSLKNSSLIISPSGYLKKIIVNKWGINSDKVIKIYNAFEINFSLNDEIKNNKELTIISVGRLVPWKCFDNLIEVFAKLLVTNPNINLYIVGVGPDLDKLKKLVSDLGIKEKIKFLGLLDHSELIKQMRAVDIFVLNSSYEGFSHVILEAMATGLPVVVSRVGGNEELINNNKNGILFTHLNNDELEANLSDLIKNKELRLTMGREAKLRVEDFSQEKMISELTSVLNKV